MRLSIKQQNTRNLNPSSVHTPYTTSGAMWQKPATHLLPWPASQPPSWVPWATPRQGWPVRQTRLTGNTRSNREWRIFAKRKSKPKPPLKMWADRSKTQFKSVLKRHTSGPTSDFVCKVRQIGNSSPYYYQSCQPFNRLKRNEIHFNCNNWTLSVMHMFW